MMMRLYKRILCFLMATAIFLGVSPYSFAGEVENHSHEEVSQTSDTENLTLDTLAWENLTYRNIFIENNLAYVNGFNEKTFDPFKQNTGKNEITDEAFYTAPYSLSVKGNTSQQLKGYFLLPEESSYFVASKVNCARYVQGTLGVCLYSTSVGVKSVTEGFVTAADIITERKDAGVFLGSFHSADLDGYVDDPVVINMAIFETSPSLDEMKSLYETYVIIEKTREREEILYSDEEMQQAFVSYMNQKASEIGMKNSCFQDPVGMDNLTTASDIMKLMVYAYENYEEFTPFWSTESHTVHVMGMNKREYGVSPTYYSSPYLSPYYHILGIKGGSLIGPKIYNLAAILEIPDSEDKLAVVALYSDGKHEESNGSRAALKQVADAALIKYNDPKADNSSASVCCQSAIACLIPAEGADFENLQILYAKDEDTQRVPASVTKVLTAICVLDFQKNLSETIKYKIIDTDIGGFYINDFLPGDSVTISDALYALMLASSNVTAMALARETGGMILQSQKLSLRYDDRYDLTGKTVEIIDAGTPTSYKVGYGVAEGTLDDAVITLDGDQLIATGIGTAKVKIDGKLYEVTVESAPISLFMITGHSMGAGQNGSADQSVVGSDGQVYSSHGVSNLSSTTEGIGISYAALNRANNVNAFTVAGSGTIGEGSALAYEWNRLTGEKVWVLNTAVGGSNLKEWIPGATNYKNAVTQYKRAQEILKNEIEAGHYTLSQMGIFYHNGANFSYKGVTFTQDDLANWYGLMWNGFKQEFLTDMDGDGKNETASFLGLIPIWTKSAGLSYTQDEPAGMFMAASKEYPDIFTASVIGQEWLTNADVAKNFPEIIYTTQDGISLIRPTTTAEVFASDNVHYDQVAYNAVGIDIAENLYQYLGGKNELFEVKLVYSKDLTEITDNTELEYGEELMIVPIVEPLTYSKLEFKVVGNMEMRYPLAVKATANGTGKLVVSIDGKVIKELTFVCSTAPETLSLRYDDRYDLTGKTVEIIDAGTPTSYKVGYGVAEGTLDDAVITLDGNQLIATGIGTAKVRMDGKLYEVTVEAAPISLLLLIGQSNMRGSEGNADQSIVCPDGMVYATYGDDRGADNTAMTVANASNFAPSALTGEYSKINVNGTTDCLKGYPINSLTSAGSGKIGPDSGFAYEWVKQTGEKVWVVNAAHGGTSISVWQPGTTEYEQCRALFTACQETLKKEIEAGHFTLSHMAYFWCQGCSDRTQSAQWYVNKYLAMHNGLQTEMSFDHDSNADTADKTFEFGGIIPVRVGSTTAGYRDGVYETKNPYAYHESYVDLRFSGPRVAQYWMCNNPELEDIWLVCNIGEDWVWMPDGTNGVSAYFNAHYPNGRVDYITQVTQKEAWYTPTTPAAVHDSIHYNQIGYNEIGRESVRNALIMLGEMEVPETETTVKFVSWDGFTEVTEVKASSVGKSATLVVPMVTPIWRAKDVTYTVSDGLTYEYYDILATDAQTVGTLRANGANMPMVTVQKQAPGALFANHLSILPEKVCQGLNLWNVLEHDKEYFASGTNWAVYSGGSVCSVTIPVKAGDRIFATSFGKAGENGHTSSGGIRMTFFSEYGVAKTMAPAETYAEFTANGGYLVAPEGAVAVNIPMWNNSESNEIYILNREHNYNTDITPPTCTEKGYTTYTCACGDNYVDDYVDALGHTIVIDKAIASTCTATGLTEGKHCSVCGEILVKQEVVKANGHTEVIDKAVAPTCTETGLTEGKHCSVCGEILVKQEVIKANGHTEVIDKAIAPTCTETGLTEGKHCSVCGEILVKQEIIKANGHTEVIDKAVAPTCTATGLTEGKHCSVCGEILVKQEIVKANGHSFTHYVSDKNATIYADGTKTATCDHCDATDTVMDEGSKLAYIRGDVNGDETLNSADAIYLLRHTIMPMLYPLAQPADMNGDGVVNSADAIYLLRHTIMPELYPIA